MTERFDDYDARRVRSRLANWPLFDPKLYRHLNPDLPDDADVALDHFALHGLWEERSFTRQSRLAAELARLKPPPPGKEAATALPASMLLHADIGIYVNGGSNFFMREVAHKLAQGLRRLGLHVTEADENMRPGERRRHSIIVAPHEFFLLGRGKAWARGDIVADVMMLSTEQPQTVWFVRSLPYLMSARGVLDLCWQTGHSLLCAGIPSAFYLPGMAETPWLAGTDNAALRSNSLVASLPQEALDFAAMDGPLELRPLDLTFMATASPIRDDFLGRHLHTLRRMKMMLIYRRPSHGVPKGYAAEDQMTAVNNFILRRSKILLNVHRDALGYFEVHRIGMQGIWNGCAVVTNACLPHPYFVAGEHYLTEALDRIPKLLQWLVGTPEGRREAERVRGAAMLRYADTCNERAQSIRIAGFLSDCFSIGTA